MTLSRFDHLSCAAPVETLCELGFSLTPTDGSAEHWRVLLDRSYIEVASPSDGAAGIRAGRWFLGGSDPATAAATLRAQRIAFTGPIPYAGRDGSWLDIEVVAATPAIPALTWRADAAPGSWPPPLAAPHANGAERLREIRIGTRDPDRLRALLLALGASDAEPRRLALPDGVVVVLEPGDRGEDGLIAATVAGSAGDVVLEFDGGARS